LHGRQSSGDIFASERRSYGCPLNPACPCSDSVLFGKTSTRSIRLPIRGGHHGYDALQVRHDEVRRRALGSWLALRRARLRHTRLIVPNRRMDVPFARRLCRECGGQDATFVHWRTWRFEVSSPDGAQDHWLSHGLPCDILFAFRSVALFRSLCLAHFWAAADSCVRRVRNRKWGSRRAALDRVASADQVVQHATGSPPARHLRNR